MSLAILALVVAAMFSSAALTKYSNFPAASPRIETETIIKLYRGQVEIFRYDPANRSMMTAPLGESLVFKWDGNWMPNGKAIAGFEARTLPPGQWIDPPRTGGYYVAFPVWILSVPFVIAPAWWLWKWNRKRRESRMDSSTAFPVRIGE